jgi:hypothetical protein
VKKLPDFSVTAARRPQPRPTIQRPIIPAVSSRTSEPASLASAMQPPARTSSAARRANSGCVSFFPPKNHPSLPSP